MSPRYHSTPSWRSRSDAATTPTKQRFRTPPEWRPRSSDAASNWSRQRAPRPVAQFLQSENALHSFAGRRKLPGGIMLDVFVFANLRLPVQVAFDAALHVRSVLERRAEHFFLLHAMRTPPNPAHLQPPCRQTSCDRILLLPPPATTLVAFPYSVHDQP